MIYPTLISTTCVKIRQISCIIFEIKSHFSRRNSPVFFLAQTLHTFYESSPSKCKFSDFPLLALKLTKLLMSFLKQKVSFSSKFASLFSIMREFFCTFLVETLCYRQRQHIKVHIFRLAIACVEIRQIPQVIFGTKSQLFNFLRMFYRILVHKV